MLQCPPSLVHFSKSGIRITFRRATEEGGKRKRGSQERPVPRPSAKKEGFEEKITRASNPHINFKSENVYIYRIKLILYNSQAWNLWTVFSERWNLLFFENFSTFSVLTLAAWKGFSPLSALARLYWGYLCKPKIHVIRFRRKMQASRLEILRVLDQDWAALFHKFTCL